MISQKLQIDRLRQNQYHIAMSNLKRFLYKNKKLIVFLLVASFLVGMPTAAERVWATNVGTETEASETTESSESTESTGTTESSESTESAGTTKSTEKTEEEKKKEKEEQEKKNAQNKKNEAQEDLDKVQDEIDKLEEEQKKLEKKLKEVRSQLSSLMDKQVAFQAQKESTQANIEQTTQDLELAKGKAEEQYQAMKLRIQYMYENSTTDNLWEAIIQADGISDMLNRVEYISTIYESDRELTEQYKETVAQVEEKERQLILQMDELLVQQEAFIGQQMEIEETIASLEIESHEFDSQLAAAEAQAKQYRETISQQNNILSKYVTTTSKPNYTGGQKVSGQEVVNYAMQFVGNPYVWGGNSLTEGCDCSGFVHLVYKHFGYKTVRYSMSFMYEGVPVSRANVQPGDIVVYAMKNGIGHVAIYAGNGKIVEAQSKSTGITAYRSIDCREIIGIRRILSN